MGLSLPAVAIVSRWAAGGSFILSEMAMSDDRVTTGEIYRICQRIEEQVTLQNSRIRKLEDAHLRIKTFWTIGAIVGGLGLDWLKHRLGF